MVATQNEEVLRVLDLVGKEQADGFERLLATVDVVAQEEIVGLGGKAAIFEQAQEIIVLAVNIAANLYSIASAYASIGKLPKFLCDPGRRRRRLTLIGASSSRRMGWEMKISRALVHR